MMGTPTSRYIDRQGYVKVNGRYEHRVVAEQMLGRELRSDEDVHHKNGNRQDNRRENLEVIGHGQHAAAHHEARRLDRSQVSSDRNRNRTATEGNAHA